MLAIILAGGLGTRLRPLTETRPKPLLPILDRPMIEYTMDLLPKEVDRVIIAVSYMADELKAYFESRDKAAREIIVEAEERPLGTGGAIKNLQRHIDGTFLALNGDVMCSLDCKRMVDFHRKKHGIGTIALWRVDDVSRYGVVELDDHMRIHQFKEKVPKAKAPSDLINAGAYILEPSIVEYMDHGKVTSIERDVFPNVIKRGLYGYRFEGHWVDAGTPASFIEAQGLVLKARGSTVRSDLDRKKIKVVEPLHICEGCDIGDGAHLGPNVFLGKGVRIGKGCSLKDCAILEGCEVGAGANISCSILGVKAKVGASAKVDGKVIADNGHFKA